MKDLLLRHVIPASLSLLPDSMDTPQARAMLVAIAMQESKVSYRKQVNGPARGFWQFEINGVDGVRHHPVTRNYVLNILESLRYPLAITTAEIHAALEHNDILACCFARLLLYTLPLHLPNADEIDDAWEQYLAAWRPGKPHRYTWTSNFEHSWQMLSEIRDI